VSGSGLPSTFARFEEVLTFTPAGPDPCTVAASMPVIGEYVRDPSSAVWANAQLSMSVSGGPNGLDQVDLQQATSRSSRV